MIKIKTRKLQYRLDIKNPYFSRQNLLWKHNDDSKLGGTKRPWGTGSTRGALEVFATNINKQIRLKEEEMLEKVEHKADKAQMKKKFSLLPEDDD